MQDVFTYTVRDADGDKTSTLTINVQMYSQSINYYGQRTWMGSCQWYSTGGNNAVVLTMVVGEFETYRQVGQYNQHHRILGPITALQQIAYRSI